MAKKTWNIGEWAVDGKIKSEVNGYRVIINDTTTIDTAQPNAFSKLFMALTDLTSSYYADKIIEWVNNQLEKSGKPKVKMFGW